MGNAWANEAKLEKPAVDHSADEAMDAMIARWPGGYTSSNTQLEDAADIYDNPPYPRYDFEAIRVLLEEFVDALITNTGGTNVPAADRGIARLLQQLYSSHKLRDIAWHWSNPLQAYDRHELAAYDKNMKWMGRKVTEFVDLAKQRFPRFWSDPGADWYRENLETAWTNDFSFNNPQGFMFPSQVPRL